MPRPPLFADPRRLAHVLRGVALGGALTGLLVLVVGNVVIGRVDLVFSGSLVLTADTLEAVDASLAVAESTVAATSAALDDLEDTTTALVAALDEADTLLGGTAELIRDDVAGALASVEQSLPTLIEVTATVDGALRALALLPFGPSYAPEEPFDRSLSRVLDSLEGLPERLTEEADQIDAASESLADVARGVLGLVDDLSALSTDLSSAVEVLGDYTSTAEEARDLVADARDDLGGQLLLARVTVVLVGLVLIAGQIVPLAMAARLDPPVLRPPSA